MRTRELMEVLRAVLSPQEIGLQRHRVLSKIPIETEAQRGKRSCGSRLGQDPEKAMVNYIAYSVCLL